MTFLVLSLTLTSADVGTDAARGLVEKAVRAQGGLDKLTGATFSHIEGNFDKNSRFQGEVFSQPGGKLRLNLDFKNEGPRTLVMDGSKGWLKFQGFVQEIDRGMQERLRVSTHVDRVCGLTALLKNKGYMLAPLGESNVDGKPALGVKVSYADMPDVSLYVDKESGLLVKVAYRAKQPFNEQMELRETYYRDYRAIDLSAADEKIVKQAGLGSDGPALLAHLRANTPDDATRKQVKQLIVQLADRSFGKREQASAELGKLGLKAAAALREASRAADPETARRAENCLRRLRESPAVHALAPAARLLVKRQPPQAVEVLLDFLPWAPDEDAGRAAQDALVLIAQAAKEPNPALLRAVKDANSTKQKAALAALGRDGGDYLKTPGRRLNYDGLRLPHHVVFFRDGRKDMEYRTTRYEFYNRFDDALFRRPE
ncbi:MAG: hypothetical protein FJ271_32065 [Planctomycetes bacterium]|nr:hypothetical protein [Planctomycetota bacterium]